VKGLVWASGKKPAFSEPAFYLLARRLVITLKIYLFSIEKLDLITIISAPG